MQSQRSLPGLLNDETGHAVPATGALVAAAGVVALGIGAANDTGWLTVTGGIVGGVGILAAFVLNHMRVSWQIFARLESLEGKKK